MKIGGTVCKARSSKRQLLELLGGSKYVLRWVPPLSKYTAKLSLCANLGLSLGNLYFLNPHVSE